MNYQSLQEEITLLHERICSALSDPTRIMILYLLSEKELIVNEISETLDMPQSTISRHLRVLRERNLVNTERQGTAVRYSLSDPRIIQSLDLMRDILTAQIQNHAAITGSITNSNSKINRS